MIQASPTASARREASHRLMCERQSLLRRVSRVLDRPMTALSFVWLGLMIVEFTAGLSPTLDAVNFGIWLAFVAHFALEFWIAPDKWRYLRRNWLTTLALLLPALRILRVFRFAAYLRAARFGRSVRLVRWFTSLNRGMRATQKTARQRGLRYVVVLTLVVNFAGAAGIYLFENPRALAEEQTTASAEAGELSDASERAVSSPATGIRNYGEALWWTSMMLTTMGSDYFPKSTEGRVIALLLAIYGFAVFGYITATVASLIIRVDQQQTAAPDFAERADDLARELALIRQELAQLRTALASSRPSPESDG